MACRPDLTTAAFTGGWYLTGDTGHIDHRGLIRLTGRIKDEINRGGIKVQPSEIDTLLEAHPAVAEACVFGIPDRASGEIVAAAVRFVPGGKYGHRKSAAVVWNKSAPGSDSRKMVCGRKASAK